MKIFFFDDLYFFNELIPEQFEMVFYVYLHLFYTLNYVNRFTLFEVTNNETYIFLSDKFRKHARMHEHTRSITI